MRRQEAGCAAWIGIFSHAALLLPPDSSFLKLPAAQILFQVFYARSFTRISRGGDWVPAKLFVLLFSYFLGNFNSGFIFSKLFFQKDLRCHGSKNPGATNAFRVFGGIAGTFVLLLDSGKGALAAAVARRLFPGELLPCLAGLCVVLGHIWPVLLRFKGGKGVATSAGVALVLQPSALLLDLVPFFILLFGTGYMSLASMACGLLLPVISLLRHGRFSPVVWLSFVQGLLIVFAHRENIKRLRRHTESKIFQKKGTTHESHRH
jgi:glycerol-3-phosphate acyltransferase PlsY